MGKLILAVKDFFNKIKNLKNIFSFKHKSIEEHIYGSERFQNYLENIDILDPSYDVIRQAIEICQESIHLSKRRLYLLDRLRIFIIKEKDLELFNSFQKEDLQKLQSYIETYRIAIKETTTLKNQISNYDKTLDYLVKFENEVESAIKEIEYHEERQAALKRDMAYISGEKEELIYSKEQLEQGLDFLYKFSIVLVCGLAVITFTVCVLKIEYNMEIFIPLIILSVLTIILGTIVYIFQRKFRYELHRNALLQVRAVELLNRAKVLYVNCTGFLRYEYKKYRVRNSAMLKNNWDEYTYQKQIARRHTAMNNRVQDVLNNVNQLLTNKGIENSQGLFEELLNLVSIEDKKFLYRDIINERKNIESELETLDNKQKSLWGQLTDLQQKDATEDSIVSHIIQSYEEEVKKLIK